MGSEGTQGAKICKRFMAFLYSLIHKMYKGCMVQSINCKLHGHSRVLQAFIRPRP